MEQKPQDRKQTSSSFLPLGEISPRAESHPATPEEEQVPQGMEAETRVSSLMMVEVCEGVGGKSWVEMYEGGGVKFGGEGALEVP